ncbi:Vacuolar amino acid transporter 7 [Diplonema papillatum]|nr:Vacuolar amino acid transporter 7 [Diplonema papillatum]
MTAQGVEAEGEAEGAMSNLAVSSSAVRPRWAAGSAAGDVGLSSSGGSVCAEHSSVQEMAIFVGSADLLHPLPGHGASSEASGLIREKVEKQPGSVLGTYINILKNIVGSGMLAIPYAFSLAGYGTGLAMFVLIQVAAVTNLYFIMKSCDMVRAVGVDPTSYLSMANTAWGTRAGQLVEVVVTCYTWSTLIAYGVLFVQFFQDPIDGLGAPGWVSGKVFILCVSFVVLLPLCCMEHIEMLKLTSVAGNAVLAYTVCLVIAHYFEHGHQESAGPAVPFSAGLGLLQALPTLVFAYNFHYNMPVYYRDLRERSIRKMVFIILAVYATVTVMYVAIALAGYFAFADETKSNIVNNLPHGASVTVCKILLGIMILFTFPVIQYATRGSISRLMARGPSAVGTGLRQRVSVGVVTIALALFVSAVTPNIGVVLAVNGAVFGVTQQYLVPSLAFWKLSAGTSLDIPPWQRSLALVVFCLGLCVGVLGLVGTITNLAQGTSR